MPVASAVAVAMAGMMRPAISFAFNLSTCARKEGRGGGSESSGAAAGAVMMNGPGLHLNRSKWVGRYGESP